MSRSRPSQRGFAFVVLAVLLVALGLGFAVLQSVAIARSQANTYQQRQLARVTDAAERVRAWYAQNPTLFDSVPADPAEPTDTTILPRAGVPAEWNLVAHVSDLLTRGNVRYREIAVLSRNDGTQQVEAFSATTGVLVLCPDTRADCPPRASTLVDGYAIEAALAARSLGILNDLALAAQAYFNGKYLASADRDVTVNWFRTPYTADGSCTHGAEDIACLDGWTPVSSSTDAQDALALLGLPSTTVTNAWGGDLYLANGNDTNGQPLGANVTTPPYRLAFQTLTPWGSAITLYAVQTL